MRVGTRHHSKGPLCWVAVSGGFDPLHVGHVRMFQAARRLGDRLVVILNNDNWLCAKKGYVFMSEKERSELLRSLPFVDRVVLTKHAKSDSDMSVSKMLKLLRPTIFANGGDRGKGNVPEEAVCKEMQIQMRYNVGRGGKVQSSSWMIRDASRNSIRTERPWGDFYNWVHAENWHLKTLHLKPKSRLSLQYHKKRSERWILVEGDAKATIGNKKALKKVGLKIGVPFEVPKRAWHRLESKNGGIVVEVSLGDFDEEDIVRIEDDYNRS